MIPPELRDEILARGLAWADDPELVRIFNELPVVLGPTADAGRAMLELLARGKVESD